MLEIKKTKLESNTKAELIAMSALWESENSCYGYRANTTEDFEKQDIDLWIKKRYNIPD